MKQLYGNKTIEQWAGHKQENVIETSDYKAGFKKGWESAQLTSELELVQITQLLQKQVMNSVGGSLSGKMDYWVEYCHANKIEQ